MSLESNWIDSEIRRELEILSGDLRTLNRWVEDLSSNPSTPALMNLLPYANGVAGSINKLIALVAVRPTERE